MMLNAIVMEVSSNVVPITEEVPASSRPEIVIAYPEWLQYVILFVFLIAVGAFIVLRPNKKQQEAAKKYLEGLANNIFVLVIANLDIWLTQENNKVPDFEDFKKKILNEVYNDSWSFVQSAVEIAVKEDKLDILSKSLIKKKSVEALVDIVFNRSDMKQKIVQAYEQLSSEFIKNLKEEEAKAKAEAEAAEAEDEEPSDPADSSTVAFLGDDEKDEQDEADMTDINEVLESEPIDDDDDPSTVG